MHLEKAFIACIVMSLFTNVFAQNTESIKVNVLKEEVVINKMVITKKTTIDEVIKAMGKPERIEKFAGKDRKYIYDSKGYAFSTAPNNPKNLVESLTITYTYDNDKNVAKEKFRGTLMIDNFMVTEKNTIKEIADKTDFEKIECFGTMCASDPKAKGIVTMIGMTESGDILQIVFGFKP